VQHDTPERVRESALIALCSLIYPGENHRHAALVAVGAIPCLLELLGSYTADLQAATAYALCSLTNSDVKMRAVLVDAGAISRIVELLGPGPMGISDAGTCHHWAETQMQLAQALSNLAVGSVAQARVVTAAGAIPRLVQLVEPGSPAVQEAAMGTLRSLAAVDDAQTQGAIIATDVMSRLVLLLVPGSAVEDQEAAIDALRNLATVGKVGPNSQIHAAMVAAGVVLHLVQLVEPGSPPEMQEAAIEGLRSLATVDDALTQAAIIATGVIQRMVQLLGSAAEVRTAAIATLRSLAGIGDPFDHLGASKCTLTQDAMVAAGALPPLVQLLVRDSPEDVQVASAGLLTKLGNDSRYRVAIVDAGAIPRLERLVGRGTGASARLQSVVCPALGVLQCYQCRLMPRRV
jgi:hypothetical protein